METSPEDKGAQEVNLYTMKEIDESLGLYYRGDSERVAAIYVEANRLTKLKMATDEMVVVNLLSH